MREIGRFIDGEFTTDGMHPAPREVVHVIHHHHPASVERSQPVERPEPRAVAPVNTVDQITDQLAGVVRMAREMSDRDRRRVYDAMHGSLSLISAMMSLKSALRREARK